MFDDRGSAIGCRAAFDSGRSSRSRRPAAGGRQLLVVADRDKAKDIADYRKMKEREAQLAKKSRVSLEGLAEQIKQAGIKELHHHPEGRRAGLGRSAGRHAAEDFEREGSRSKCCTPASVRSPRRDVLLASASNAIIIGFNVRPERKAQELAEQEKVDIRLHSIIYELQDEIKQRHDRIARACLQGNVPGPRRSARDLQYPEGRHDRRLPRDRRRHQARCGSSPAARQHAGVQRQDRLAAPLQRRRQGSDAAAWNAVSPSPAMATSRLAT